MEQQVVQQTEMKTGAQAAKYVRWGVAFFGIAFLLATFVMMIYRKFGD